MGTTMRATLLAAAAALTVLPGLARAQTYAVTNARVLMTGTAQSPGGVDDATVLVRDGKVAEVGQDVRVPIDAEVIDAAGGTVTPGLFAALSGLGLEEIGLNEEGNDRSPRGEVGLSASIDAADGFYADSSVIPINRAGGVARAYVAPDPGEDLFGGCGMLVRLAPERGDTVGEGAITDRCLAQTISLGYAGAARTGDSRPAAMSELRRALDDARDYADDPALYRRTYEAGRLPTRDADALVPLMTGRQKALVQVQGASDIRRVLDLSDEYGLDLILYGAVEAYRVADELAARRVPVILDPLQNLPANFESFGATLEAARVLEEAGVLVAFYDGDIGYTHNLRNLTQLAGNAVANGMSYAGALSAITANPALIWDRPDLGTVAPGQTADLVVWDGDPLEGDDQAPGRPDRGRARRPRQPPGRPRQALPRPGARRAALRLQGIGLAARRGAHRLGRWEARAALRPAGLPTSRRARLSAPHRPRSRSGRKSVRASSRADDVVSKEASPPSARASSPPPWPTARACRKAEASRYDGRPARRPHAQGRAAWRRRGMHRGEAFVPLAARPSPLAHDRVPARAS